MPTRETKIAPPQLATAERAWRDFPSWVLVGILLIAASLRLWAVQSANFWLDEFWTLELSCGHDTAHEHLPLNVILQPAPALTSLADARPWWNIWTTMDQVTHPPLFFLLLRLWRTVLGPGDIAARMLPLLASLVAVVLFYRVVRQLSGIGPALWAALLMALSGQQIFYAQEVRSYSLLVALGLAACAVVVEIEQKGERLGRLIALGAICYALLMTHYFSVGVIAGLAVYAAIRLPRRAALRIVAAFGVAGLLFLVSWGPWMLRQRNAMGLENPGGAAFLLERDPGHLLHTARRLLATPAVSISPADYINPDAPIPWVAWLALPAVLLPLLLLRGRRDLLLWYIWAAAVLLPLLILDLSRHSMHLAFGRYTLLAGPAVVAIMAGGFRFAKPLWNHVVPALMALACVVMLPSALRQAAAKPDWPGVLAMNAAASMVPGDSLIVTAAPDVAPLVYLYVSHYLAAAPAAAAIVTRPCPPDLLRQLQAHGKIWVINAWDLSRPSLSQGSGALPR